MNDIRVILIGGTSHTGKSTLAEHLAHRPGWKHVSTDKLARHPGRPWGAIPPQVIQHYLKLDVVALMASVTAHYESMAPSIDALLRKHAANPEPKLVLEGSALLPQTVSRFRERAIAGIFLVADDILTSDRIRAESDYVNREARERIMIDKFIARALAFNRYVTEGATERNLPLLEIDGKMSTAELADACLARMTRLA